MCPENWCPKLWPVQELPSQISSEEERELLALMCRVHELEVEKMALQSERFIKQHELWRRDLVIFRYDRQRHLCEEIITRQRQLMEGKLTIRYGTGILIFDHNIVACASQSGRMV